MSTRLTSCLLSGGSNFFYSSKQYNYAQASEVETRNPTLDNNKLSCIDPPIPEPRPRYAIKIRKTAKQHERPETILQYKWKESNPLGADETPADPEQADPEQADPEQADPEQAVPDNAAKRRKMIEKRKTDKLTATSNKKMILTALEYEHPFATLH